MWWWMCGVLKSGMCGGAGHRPYADLLERSVLEAPGGLGAVWRWHLPPPHAREAPADNILGVPKLDDDEHGRDHEIYDEVLGEVEAEEVVQRRRGLHQQARMFALSQRCKWPHVSDAAAPLQSMPEPQMR